MTESLNTHIIVGSDHAGLDLKNFLRDQLSASGVPVTDVGTETPDSVDYPDFAEKVARRLRPETGEIGVLVCGTGIGVSIAANKIPGIRAALVYNDETASLARRHNNANIICLGGREISPDDAIRWVRIFISSQFEGGRHQRRIDKIAALEPPAEQHFSS
ncbi:MAG: ribose 5-phosphate isomerase B [Leptospirales bacterium]